MTRPDRIAIFLGHPAHYHMFKNIVAQLEQQGIEVDYLVKRKDMLEDLVKTSGHRYYVVRHHERPARRKIGLAWALVSMELNVIAYIFRRRPRLLIGTYAPVISHLTGVPMIVCCEDDTAIVPRFARTSYPYATAILAPTYCNGGKWDDKMTKYAGFQKLAYLHPKWFTPSHEIIAPCLRHTDRPTALLRFAKLQAHHDNGIHGIDNNIALKLVNRLQDTHDVYISSERPLPSELEAYRLHINPADIHHWLAFADIYIGDSQSMAVEAAILGTPSIRYSDFAGHIGVLNTLENRYHLAIGIPSDQPERLFAALDTLLATPDLKATYQKRRQAMLSEQVDVVDFFTHFILDQLARLHS